MKPHDGRGSRLARIVGVDNADGLERLVSAMVVDAMEGAAAGDEDDRAWLIERGCWWLRLTFENGEPALQAWLERQDWYALAARDALGAEPDTAGAGAHAAADAG